MCSKEIHEEELATLRQCQGGESEVKPALKLDDEILGGHVDYSLIDLVRRLNQSVMTLPFRLQLA